MSPQMMEPQKRKRKEKAKLEFEPDKVFGVEPAMDVQLDLESSQYRARHGEGGDRRG